MCELKILLMPIYVDSVGKTSNANNNSRQGNDGGSFYESEPANNRSEECFPFQREQSNQSEAEDFFGALISKE